MDRDSHLPRTSEVLVRHVLVIEGDDIAVGCERSEILDRSIVAHSNDTQRPEPRSRPPSRRARAVRVQARWRPDASSGPADRPDHSRTTGNPVRASTYRTLSQSLSAVLECADVRPVSGRPLDAEPPCRRHRRQRRCSTACAVRGVSCSRRSRHSARRRVLPRARPRRIQPAAHGRRRADVP